MGKKRSAGPVLVAEVSVEDPSGDELVVATPERVAFGYAVAGPGSRFLAQCIDWIILGGLLFAAGLAAAFFGAATGSLRLGVLAIVIVAFVVVIGYFPVFEALWSGRTPGKRALRLRVVGDQGEPLRFSQAVIRNLVRLVDFLPAFYGVGLVTLFINGQGKRLGDLAAGTLVVRERDRVSLRDLSGASRAPASPTPAAPRRPASIWEQPAGAPAPVETSPPVGEEALRQLDPALRRFVLAYARRRQELPIPRREALAKSAEPALRAALPRVVAEQGALAALDRLADLEAPRG